MINADQLLAMTVIPVGEFMDAVNFAINEPTDLMTRRPWLSVDELMSTVTEHALMARPDNPDYWKQDMFPEWVMGLYYETRDHITEEQTFEQFRLLVDTADIINAFMGLVENILINVPLNCGETAECVFHKVVDELLIIAHPLPE